MQDLNDLAYFSQVVAHGGFAAAARALRIPKSKLSRRVAQLEKRLGVRLLERSSRRFRVTEIGKAFHEQCVLALDAAHRAETLVQASLTEPRGLVRCACPTGLVPVVAPLVPQFLKVHPHVRLQLVATDRAVDLIGERIDVAIRVRVRLETDASLTLRTLGKSRRVLLASPTLANALRSQDISALCTLPTLTSNESDDSVVWTLHGPEGRVQEHRHSPRLACGDFTALRVAASNGLGVALLPLHACSNELESGTLVRLFPDWHAPDGIVHLVFTTRVGLPPQVRAWNDHLAQHLRIVFEHESARPATSPASTSR